MPINAIDKMRVTLQNRSLLAIGEATSAGSVAEILKVIWPVIVLQFALAIWALVDLVRRDNVRYLPKVAWAVIVLFVNIVGPIVYLAFGRGE